MIDGDGNARITDFGIATAASDAGGAVAGTPQYMAPEQLAGRAATIKTDIYALGLILFEMFTGRRPHDAKTVADLKALHDTGTRRDALFIRSGSRSRHRARRSSAASSAIPIGARHLH